MIFFFTANPTGFVNIQILVGTMGAIFVQQAILDHFKLKCPHGANHFAVVEVQGKQLGHTFVHQLVDAFVKLLGFHRVGIIDISEMLRRKGRDPLKLYFFLVGKGVANFKVACVVKSYNISGIGHIHNFFFLCKKGIGAREFQFFSLPYMQVGGVPLKGARHDLYKGQTVAVLGVHIGMDFKDKATKLFFIGLNQPLIGLFR